MTSMTKRRRQAEAPATLAPLPAWAVPDEPFVDLDGTTSRFLRTPPQFIRADLTLTHEGSCESFELYVEKYETTCPTGTEGPSIALGIDTDDIGNRFMTATDARSLAAGLLRHADMLDAILATEVGR